MTKWYEFGLTLGIPTDVLDCIKEENPTIEKQKIKMFQFWLRSNVHASWKMVIQALEQKNDLTLATKLKKKYLSDAAGKSVIDRVSLLQEGNASIKNSGDMGYRLKNSTGIARLKRART